MGKQWKQWLTLFSWLQKSVQTVTAAMKFKDACSLEEKLWPRRSNQSIQKKIDSEYSLEGVMLKLKLQYFGHLMQRADSFEKTLMLGRIEGRRRRERERMRLDEVGWHHRLNGHGFGWTLGVGDGQGGLACCDSWDRKESDMNEQLNWTELMLRR